MKQKIVMVGGVIAMILLYLVATQFLLNRNAMNRNTQIANVDVDLAEMGSTMVYAEVYNILMDPTAYLGKNIRVQGEYNQLYNSETGSYDHYIIIKDALACCATGLDFLLQESDSNLELYPEQGSNIELIGEYKQYENYDYDRYYLSAEVAQVIESSEK
ncbi:MAG: hypothetical protein ACK5LZ_05410 [Anaerorhabdus sp.]